MTRDIDSAVEQFTKRMRDSAEGLRERALRENEPGDDRLRIVTERLDRELQSHVASMEKWLSRSKPEEKERQT
jgi:hypothetical protein